MRDLSEQITPYDPEVMKAIYAVTDDIATAEFDEILARRRADMGDIPPAPPDINLYLEQRAQRLTQPPTEGEQ
jgi:hypothetical protein